MLRYILVVCLIINNRSTPPLKTKFLLSFLLLSQILAVSGCARQESPDIAEGSVPAAVSVAEPEGPPDTAEETES